VTEIQTFIDRKGKMCSNENEKLEYLALKALASEDLTEILTEFGIDSKKVNFEAERFLGKQISKTQ
jgi:hypothetical protein